MHWKLSDVRSYGGGPTLRYGFEITDARGAPLAVFISETVDQANAAHFLIEEALEGVVEFISHEVSVS